MAETEPIEPEPETKEPFVLPPWLVPLCIGIVTITAGLFTWRGGQLASNASFQDRTSVGQTITEQERATSAGIGAVNDAVAYVRYRAGYAEAAVLDQLSVEADASGQSRLAADFTTDADRIRLSASQLAVAAGVFGSQSVLTEVATDSSEPLSFDLQEQYEQLLALEAIGVDSSGKLEPDRWADEADATRHRTRKLRVATIWLMGAVAALTVAQFSRRHWTRRIGVALGSMIYLVATVATMTSVY